MGTYQNYFPTYTGSRAQQYLVNPAQLREIVPPAVEPVTLEQAKQHLRVDFPDDDAYIDMLIVMARQLVEKEAARALVERTSTAIIPCFADVIRLPLRPIESIQKIEYWSADSPSVLTTLYDVAASPEVNSADFEFDKEHGVIIRAYSGSWPSVATRHDAVQITFVHGEPPLGSPEDQTVNVPEPLKHAMKLCIADMYENREEHTPLTMQRLPAYEKIIRLYRYRR